MRRTRLIAAAGLPAAFYLLYVSHYAVNVPYADDWNFTPVVINAANGHLGMNDLWSQYGDTRLLIPKIWFVIFARIDHYNVRHIIIFSAVILIASYVLLLRLFYSYLGKKLTFVPVVLLGMVWFSLADVQNSLWSFQLAWYLATFFFVAMIYLLLEPRWHWAMFGLGIIAAVAASCSIVQGYVAWPVGLVCVLWRTPWARRTIYETAAWIAATVLTTAVYFHSFNTTSSSCAPNTRTCTAGYGLMHPQLLIRYVVLLIGNVIPTSFALSGGLGRSSANGSPNIVAHEVLGTVLALVAAFVVIQCIRERPRQASPLPVLLIAFGFFFDGLIAIGRFGAGPAGAVTQDRYTMPNLVLLAGIVAYAGAHVPPLRPRDHAMDRRGWIGAIALVTVCGFVLVQYVATVDFGISNGRKTHQAHETTARITVNLDSLPSVEQACDAAYAVIPPEPPSGALYFLQLYGGQLAAEGWSVFEPATFRRYRLQGPPTRAAITAAADVAAVRELWVTSCF